MTAALVIEPPILNSASPWATSYDDLLRLYRCKSTGAVTTRTSTLDGFPHDDSIHKYAFFNSISHTSITAGCETDVVADKTSSLNNLGYSPLNLDTYLSFIQQISNLAQKDRTLRHDKPFIISITGSDGDALRCYTKIQALQSTVTMPLAMEINLSCPNIPNKPPPAYSAESLQSYLMQPMRSSEPLVPVGFKLPPYTYAGQFENLISTLLSITPCQIDFLTSTNTLGNSLLLDSQYAPALSPDASVDSGASGLGGMAGTALHPLALGNVQTLKRHISAHDALSNIMIIGVGGVEDTEGYGRMRSVGADAVALATSLGRKGIAVFEQISTKLTK